MNSSGRQAARPWARSPRSRRRAGSRRWAFPRSPTRLRRPSTRERRSPSLIADWLAQTDPTPTPPPNPPPTYQDTDFDIWSQTLASADPTGYLFLDLDTLTQGYLIPPFVASPCQTANAGQTTLTFVGTAIGIGVGMPVSGKNIAPDTTVTNVDTITTVKLSKAHCRERGHDYDADHVQRWKFSDHRDAQYQYRVGACPDVRRGILRRGHRRKHDR